MPPFRQPVQSAHGLPPGRIARHVQVWSCSSQPWVTHIESMRRSEKRPADRSNRQDKSHLMVARTKATNNQREFSNSPKSRRRSAKGGAGGLSTLREDEINEESRPFAENSRRSPNWVRSTVGL